MAWTAWNRVWCWEYVVLRQESVERRTQRIRARTGPKSSTILRNFHRQLCLWHRYSILGQVTATFIFDSWPNNGHIYIRLQSGRDYILFDSIYLWESTWGSTPRNKSTSQDSRREGLDHEGVTCFEEGIVSWFLLNTHSLMGL